MNTPPTGPLCRHWGSRSWGLGIVFVGVLQDICADPGFPLDMYPLFRCGSGRQLDGTVGYRDVYELGLLRRTCQCLRIIVFWGIQLLERASSTLSSFAHPIA